MMTHDSKYSNAKVLVLAPHLTYPLRNGADILVDRRWGELSHFVDSVEILARDRLVRYVNGVSTIEYEFGNGHRSKVYSSLRVVFYRSHYLIEKFLTRSYRELANRHLFTDNHTMIVCSFIATASLIEPESLRGRPCYIETHNDEIKWFDDIHSSSKNIFVKLVASSSRRWLIRFVQKCPRFFTYIHVSKADEEGYKIYEKSIIGIIGPVGCDIEERHICHSIPSLGSPVRLLFVGSLGVKMNFDALNNFSKHFQSVLSSGIPQGIEVRVAGSDPTEKIKQLCKDNSWELHPNLSEEEMVECFKWTDFTFLPFSYATGGKLKLLKSMALGVPFLATSSVAGGLAHTRFPSIVSDDPSEWLEVLLRVQLEGISADHRERLKDMAKTSSWQSIAANLCPQLFFRVEK